MATAGQIQSLGSIIIQGNIKFVVPDFQRNYAWDDEQIDALLDDLAIGASSQGSHFIGSLIVQIDPAYPNIALVIDGQQRLTTIFMIVSCLRDYVAYLDKHVLDLDGNQSINVLDKLSEFLFTLDEVTYEQLDRFEAHPMISEMFSTQILANPLPNRPQLPPKHHQYSLQLRKAHKRIKRWPSEQLKEFAKGRAEAGLEMPNEQDSLAWILRVLSVLKDKIKLLQISTQDEAESFDIFMSLNSTGKNLGAADLVKSHIFSRLTAGMSAPERSRKNRELTELWQGVLTNLDEGDIDQFLRHYLLSRQGARTVREKDIFPIFKELIEPKGPDKSGTSAVELAELHLDKIIKASAVYEELLECNALNSFEGQRALKTLVEIGSAYRILLMKVFAEDSVLTDLEKEAITLRVEAFNLRWVLTGGNAQILENFYQELANTNPENGEPFSAAELSARIEQKTPDDDELKIKFQAEAPSPKQTKLILFRIEQELGLRENYNPKSVHLELIAPSKESPGYGTWLDHLFPGENEAMELEYETTVSQWGNITIVEKPLPVKSRGASFAEKTLGDEDYDGYGMSKFRLTKDIGALNNWDRFIIKRRNDWIGSCVVKIWPVAGEPEAIESFRI